LVKAFRWPEIRNSATVDGVISVVDCDALASGQLVGDLDALEAQRQADPNLEHETPIEELFEDQLACADSILLTKTDLVDGETLAKVKNWLTQEVSDGVKIIECDRGRVNPDVLLGFNAAVEEDLDNRPSHHDSEDDHEHDDDINSVYLSFDRGFDPAELVQQLSEVVKQHEIYRIKGFVAVPDKKMRLVLQGVGKRFDHFYDRPWKSNEPRQTRIVLIGRQLNRDAIASAMSQPLSAVG
jgi:cobalamin biosynthesis protein CobW